jgi:ABC-type nitrate/sulfonate/bicarbonate transport system substrate-binding protein
MSNFQPAQALGAGTIRIGFVPLCDCAPVIMAHELGLFVERGLRVELSREVGWATVRDKIALRELEAAHAPAAMVLSLSMGIGSFSVPCVTGLVLNLHGNAITLSNRLLAAGVHDLTSLRQVVRSRRRETPLAFGVAYSCSSHNFLLQRWLRSADLDPIRDVHIVVVPPPQMAPNLRTGNLDGYCVGEPWNSLAVAEESGWIAAPGSAIAPGHPEKALIVRSTFAETRADEHCRLIAALLEACQFCQQASNRAQVSRILAAPKYLGIDQEVIQRSLCRPLRFGTGKAEQVTEMHIFSGPEVNEPGLQKAVWARQSLVETGMLPKSNPLSTDRLSEMFRCDIFQSAASFSQTRALVSPGS